MEKTAVEWLVDELRKLAHDKSHHLGIGDIRISQGHLDELEEQAKEMENEQQDEYAIEFTEWCNDNYFRMGNTNIWLESKDFEIPIKYTTKELLEIFKKK